MNKIKKILAPTDYSDLSCVALRHAFETGRELGAEVAVLHVVAMSDDWFSKQPHSNPARDLMVEQKAFLDKFLREKFADWMNLLEVRQEVELGTPHSNIAEFAEREGIDVIMMATHGRTGLDHMLIGSVTEKVLALASCPVLAIPARKAPGAIPRAA